MTDATKFPFTHYICIDGVPIAEIEGECQVDADGDFDIKLVGVLGSAKENGKRPLVGCGPFHDEIANMLLFHYAADIDEARRAAIGERAVADREVAADVRNC